MLIKLFSNKKLKGSSFGLILVGIIYAFLPNIIVLIYSLETHNGGKFKDFDSISEYVVHNQDTLEEISVYMLSQGENLDISIKEDEIVYLNGSEEIKDDLLQNVIINDLFDEQYFRDIEIYKNESMQIVAFRTYSAVPESDGSMGGFYYFEGNELDEVVQYWFFNEYPFETTKIMDNWFFFKLKVY